MELNFHMTSFRVILVALLELLSWCLFLKPSHDNSFEHQVHVNFIYRWPILKILQHFIDIPQKCEESYLLVPLRSIPYRIGESINPCCAKNILQLYLYFWPNLSGASRFWHQQVYVMGTWWTVSYNNSCGFCAVPLSISQIHTDHYMSSVATFF